MIRRVCSKIADFLVSNGGYYLVIAILFVGTFLASPDQLNAELLFNIAEGLALVTIAIAALKTWRNVEHWKIKKETFSYLLDKKNDIHQLIKIITRLSINLHRFIDMKHPPYEINKSISKNFIRIIKKSNKSLRDQIDTLKLHNINNELLKNLISIDIKWARDFSDLVDIQINEVLEDENGFNSITALMVDLEFITTQSDPDEIENSEITNETKQLNRRLADLVDKCFELQDLLDATINKIERKLGTTL